MTEQPHLTPQHREKLERHKAIAPEVIAEAGYRSIRRTDPFPESAGFADYQQADGYLLPIYPPDGTNGRYMLRRDVNRVATDRETGKQRTIKYEQAAGMPHRLHAPPRCRRWLDDVRVPVWFTEGIDKSNALASAGRCAVALPGVWVFKTPEVLEKDWPLIALEGRTAIVAFDSDAATNSNVAKAADTLAAFLAQRGARVLVVSIPAKPNGEKVAVDDYLAQGGDLVDLLAQHAEEWHSPADGPCGRDVCRETRRELAEVRELESLEARIIAAPKDNGLKPNRRLPALLLVRRYYSDVRRSIHPLAREGEPERWQPTRPVVDGDGWDTINMKSWAQDVGLSDDTLRKTARELADLGVLEVETPHETLASGQIVTRTKIRPKTTSLAETVRNLTTVVQAPSGWGGKRVWRCPEHHGAKVELKHVCAACGRDAELVEVEPTGTQVASRLDETRTGAFSSSAPHTNGTQLASRSLVRPAVPPAGLQLASRLARERQERDAQTAPRTHRLCAVTGCETLLPRVGALLCAAHRAPPTPPTPPRPTMSDRQQAELRRAGVDVAAFEAARAAGADILAITRATGVEGDLPSLAAAFPCPAHVGAAARGDRTAAADQSASAGCRGRGAAVLSTTALRATLSARPLDDEARAGGNDARA